MHSLSIYPHGGECAVELVTLLALECGLDVADHLALLKLYGKDVLVDPNLGNQGTQWEPDLLRIVDTPIELYGGQDVGEVLVISNHNGVHEYVLAQIDYYLVHLAIFTAGQYQVFLLIGAENGLGVLDP